MINDFLVNTLEKMKDSLKSSSFLKSIKDGDIHLSVIYNEVELKTRLDELQICLEKILTIANKPHIQSSKEEVIKLSVSTSSISSNQFLKTMKQPSLWKENNKGVYPEKVFTSEKTETINIYENRFIILLLSKIVDEVSFINQEFNSNHQSLISKMTSKSLTFESTSPFCYFNFLKFPYNFKLPNVKNDNELETKLLKIQSMISVIKQTDFYCILSKLPPLEFINPTNILIHELSYNYCYKFYVKNFLNKSENSDNLYYNFVILTLLSVLPFPVDDKRVNLRFDEYERLRFEPSRVKIGNILLRLSEDKNNLGFKLDTLIVNNNNKIIDSSSYYLLVTKNYNSENSEIINNILREKQNRYTDSFIVALNNTTLIQDHILNIKFSNNSFKLIWENFIKQMTFFIDLKDDSYYLNYCPVCGSDLIINNNHEKICSNCNSHYHLINKDNQKQLWVNSFFKKDYSKKD